MVICAAPPRHWTRKVDDPIVCEWCGKPATCVGAYDGQEIETAACDDCCGHACEDGRCVPIEGNMNNAK